MFKPLLDNPMFNNCRPLHKHIKPSCTRTCMHISSALECPPKWSIGFKWRNVVFQVVQVVIRKIHTQTTWHQQPDAIRIEWHPWHMWPCSKSPSIWLCLWETVIFFCMENKGEPLMCPALGGIHCEVPELLPRARRRLLLVQPAPGQLLQCENTCE